MWVVTSGERGGILSTCPPDKVPVPKSLAHPHLHSLDNDYLKGMKHRREKMSRRSTLWLIRFQKKRTENVSWKKWSKRYYEKIPHNWRTQGGPIKGAAHWIIKDLRQSTSVLSWENPKRFRREKRKLTSKGLVVRTAVTLLRGNTFRQKTMERCLQNSEGRGYPKSRFT